jgi:hypothetical protein
VVVTRERSIREMTQKYEREAQTWRPIATQKETNFHHRLTSEDARTQDKVRKKRPHTMRFHPFVSIIMAGTTGFTAREEVRGA